MPPSVIEQAMKEGSTEEIQAAYFDDSIHNYCSEEGSPESMHILILLLSTTIRLYLSDHITLHNHICKEQSKDSFYIDFVLQSIIKMLALFWVCQGGGVASLK